MAQDPALPPLISPGSPSYERARRELKHPSPTGDPVVVAVLSRLVELEQGALQTCLAAAARVADPDPAGSIGDACNCHRQRVSALGTLITDLGGAPPRADEIRDLLVNGPAAVEDATSDDQVMDVLRSLRRELTEAYAQAARDPELDDAQRAALAALI